MPNTPSPSNAARVAEPNIGPWGHVKDLSQCSLHFGEGMQSLTIMAPAGGKIGLNIGDAIKELTETEIQSFRRRHAERRMARNQPKLPSALTGVMFTPKRDRPMKIRHGNAFADLEKACAAVVESAITGKSKPARKRPIQKCRHALQEIGKPQIPCTRPHGHRGEHSYRVAR